MSKAISVGCTFQREVHAGVVEGLEDGEEPATELLVAAVPVLLGRRWERVQRMPDRAAGEAGDHAHTQRLRGAGGVRQLLGRALAYPLGLPVTPDVRGHHGLVAFVDRVAYGLTHQVVADGVEREAVVGEQLTALLGVVGFRDGAAYVEVIAPAGELEAVVAHLLRQGGELG